ncbi:lycopene cyclase domain-containing protein [Sorangium sp. So ce385]|uniref:lycopene cyclase domain-containing protein n=1 Tax=Sorangium sp. So ce385 TaxID=3133308 RepID=UPI003F5B1F1D
MTHEFLLLSVLFLLPGMAIWVARPDLRALMKRAAVASLPFAATERLFYPTYWTPKFLFDLADRVGFGVEDLLFLVGLSAFSSTAYAVVFRRALVPCAARTRSGLAERTRPGLRAVRTRPGLAARTRPGLRAVRTRPGLRAVRTRPGLRVARTRPGLRVARTRPWLAVRTRPGLRVARTRPWLRARTRPWLRAAARPWLRVAARPWLRAAAGVALALATAGALLAAGVPVLYAAVAAMIAVTAALVGARRDLLVPGLLGALLSAALYLGLCLVFAALVPGVFERTWRPSVLLPGRTLLGVPVDEILYGLGAGLAATVFPAWAFELRYTKVPRADRRAG